MDEKNIYIVRNRSSSRVCYVIPEEGIRREFQPGESKKISFAELEKLSFQPGGRAMMSQFLQIKSQQATDELGIHTEPEYNMSEQEIINLIKTGSVDSFLDCLDFAPRGVVDLVKKYAIEVPLENTQKIEALKEKTGFDVIKARENLRAEKKEDEESGKITPVAPGRRVPIESAEPATPERRTAPKYNVVSTGK